jgi:hypothetical protein
MSNERIKAMAKCVADLRASNPPLFGKFMTLLAARLDEITEQLVTAQPDRLAQLQGSALEARALFKELVDAPALAERVQQKEQTSGTTARQP